MSVKILHDQAMALNEKSIVLERNGDIDGAKKIAEEAFNLEFQAASLLEAKKENEPTRSILYCSAASIAVRAGSFENAKNAAKKGLEGFPDLRIKHELLSASFSTLSNYNTSKDLTILKELLDQGYKVVGLINHKHWVDAFVSEKRLIAKDMLYFVNREYFTCEETLYKYCEENNIEFIIPNLEK